MCVCVCLSEYTKRTRGNASSRAKFHSAEGWWEGEHRSHYAPSASIVNNGERINEFAILLSRSYDLMFLTFSRSCSYIHLKSICIYVSCLPYKYIFMLRCCGSFSPCLVALSCLLRSRWTSLAACALWPGTASNLITDHVELAHRAREDRNSSSYFYSSLLLLLLLLLVALCFFFLFSSFFLFGLLVGSQGLTRRRSAAFTVGSWKRDRQTRSNLPFSKHYSFSSCVPTRIGFILYYSEPWTLMDHNTLPDNILMSFVFVPPLPSSSCSFSTFLVYSFVLLVSMGLRRGCCTNRDHYARLLNRLWRNYWNLVAIMFSTISHKGSSESD